MAYDDPKPGRWILPVIVVGMVVLTYAFVNRLEPAESPTGSPPEDPASQTSTTDVSTTLPEDLAQYLVTLDIWENRVRSYGADVERVNSRWENRDTTNVTYAETRTGFLNIQTQLRNFETEIAQYTNVPPLLDPGHIRLILEVGDLPLKMGDILVGLEAPDDGTGRRTAVAEFAVEVDQVLDAMESIRATARGETSEPDSTTPTDPDDGEDPDDPGDDTDDDVEDTTTTSTGIEG